jgi:hypothetical protein
MSPRCTGPLASPTAERFSAQLFGAGACYQGNNTKNMKTNSILALSFLAVLAAIIILPISAAASSIALTLTGVLAILVSDYGRELQPVQSGGRVIPVDFAGRETAGLNKAA